MSFVLDIIRVSLFNSADQSPTRKTLTSKALCTKLVTDLAFLSPETRCPQYSFPFPFIGHVKVLYHSIKTARCQINFQKSGVSVSQLPFISIFWAYVFCLQQRFPEYDEAFADIEVGAYCITVVLTGVHWVGQEACASLKRSRFLHAVI